MKNWTMRLLCLVLALAMCLGGCTPAAPESTGSAGSAGSTGSTGATGSTGSSQPADGKTLTIYWDYTGDLATADVWAWADGKDGKGYMFEKDAFGCKTVISMSADVVKMGFITRYDCSDPGTSSWGTATKDIEADRFVNLEGSATTIYLKMGDDGIYYSDDNGETLYSISENGDKVPFMSNRITQAAMTSFTTIKYNVKPAVRLTSLEQIKVYQDGQQIPVTGLSSLNNEVTTGTITLGQNLDLTKSYEVEIEGYSRRVVSQSNIFDCAEFIANYTYDGDDLGAVIHGADTTFKVWAPTASKVVLNLFESGHEGKAYQSVDMVKGDRGVWEYTAGGVGHGTYYTYTVSTCIGTNEATDPYAKAAGLNGNRSMVVDLERTNPAGWDADQVVELEKYTDATIWEIHVRDFSNRIESSQYQGKYLAFTELGLVNGAGVSVGMDYLKNLGVSHIHLLPVYDYATVDESNPNSGFNWGYDPKNYNVPEGSYSTDPYNGEVRINEFKQMVQSLHNQGLGVIMDVVYNHTYSADSNFHRIVPYYYYRHNADGSNTSASGCGNDTASERYMFSKFMVDSVKYWASEYNLDGFRFDLMGLHDLETMRKIEQAVHEINPNAIIYGEGWTMGSTINREPQANQTNISKIETSEGAAGSVAVFNDAIRDGLKGSVFDEKSQGYINGDFRANEAKVQFAIEGSKQTAVAGWKVEGAASINYMSAHDNHTLWDKLTIANADNTKEERLAMNRLGAAIVMISQGTPFWQAGEEILRTKDGDHNSYKSSDEINNIKWETLTTDSDEYAMMLYYKGLIEMRKEYDIFRGNGNVTVKFGKLSGGGMTVEMSDENGNKALVLINPTDKAASHTLEGSWNLVANSTQAGKDTIRTDSGEVTVDAIGVLVYVN